MTSRRMPVLLTILVGILALRWMAPLTEHDTAEVVAALPRTTALIFQAARVDSPRQINAPTRLARIDPQPERFGNAFAVRMPQAASVPMGRPAIAPVLAPPAPAPIQAAPTPAVAAAPALPAPTTIPLPQLAVIGTWDDGGAPAAFIAASGGTLFARAGEKLLAEFDVTAVTARSVTLRHVVTGASLELPVPQVPTTPPRP